MTLLIVLTLALGIGASTAIVSVVNSVILRPLPFKEPARLVGLRETLPDEGTIPLAYRTFAEWRDRNTVFESIAAMVDFNFNFESRDPIRVRGVRVSSAYFTVMGIQPILGRGFNPEETLPGAAKAVVIGDDFWQKQFGGDPNIIGKTIKLNDDSYTIVGVMPSTPDLMEVGWANLWVPFVANDERARRNPGRYLRVNARLKPGVTFDQAKREVDDIMTLIRQDFPETHGKPYGVDIRVLQDFVVSRDTRLVLLVLLGIVLCVLFIACANVANLMLVRAAIREREIALRTALGASRWRVVRQLLTESLLLSILGATGGLLLAKVGIKLLLVLKPEAVPRLDAVAIDTRVLGFTIGITVVVAVLVGLAPILTTSRLDVNSVLKDGARGAQARRHNRLRALLVVSEVAMAVVLLIGSGLMIRTYARLRNIELGLTPDDVLTMGMSLTSVRYNDGTQRTGFYRELLHRLRALPGVATVSLAEARPIVGPTVTDPIYFEGQPVPPSGQEPYIRQHVITSDYFQVFGIQLIKGRTFTEQETWETGGVAIVNETFVNRFLPNSEPLGQRIKRRPDQPWLTIVGVYRNVLQHVSDSARFEEVLHTYADPTSPYPLLSGLSLAMRTNVQPASLTSSVREEIRRLDPELPVTDVLTMQEIVDQMSAVPRFNMFLFTLFGAIALILAAVGIYGVMSQMVTQQTHQIGIRMALGAQPVDVMRLVLGKGMVLSVLGLLIGIAGSVLLSGVMGSLLYDVVSGTDLVTYAGLSVVLVGTAFLACYIPARRAVRIEPVIALRHE